LSAAASSRLSSSLRGSLPGLAAVTKAALRAGPISSSSARFGSPMRMTISGKWTTYSAWRYAASSCGLSVAIRRSR
jgi:hypothetical protein